MAFLSDEEARKVIRNFLETRGESGATKEEIMQVIKEVVCLRISGLLADMIVNGEIPVNLVNGEIMVGGILGKEKQS